MSTHHHSSSPEIFSPSQTETRYTLNTNSLLFFTSVLDNYHFTFCVSIFDYSVYLILMILYNICPFVTGLFHLASCLQSTLMQHISKYPSLFPPIFWPCHGACGILVPWPGVKPEPPAVKAQSLKNWTAREVPSIIFSKDCSLLIDLYRHSFPFYLIWSEVQFIWVTRKV